MRSFLSVFFVFTLFLIAALSCNEPSGPLEVSDPTESILTVTLEEKTSLHSNTGDRISVHPEERSIISELSLERTGKGEYQAVAVWTQCPDDNFTWYAIYRSQTPGIASNTSAADTSVVFSSASDTSWIDTGISEGDICYYAVRTVNADDLDSWSNEDSVAVPSSAPPTPSTLTGTYTGDGTFSQITLEWTECPDSDFYCYKLYRSTSPDIAGDPLSAEIVATGEGSGDTSYEDNEVEGLTTYYYAVETLNESQLSSWSNEDSVAVPSSAPPTPSTLTGIYTGDGSFCQITLEWTECPDSDFYCYNLYRSTSPDIEGNTSSAEIVSICEESGDTAFEDNEVEELTAYYYAVETLNESQLSSWSNEISVTTPELIPRLTVFFIDPSHNDYYSGDVILIRTPDNCFYLIDGGDRSGSWSCGIEKVLPLLDSLGADSLDGIVGTHPHSDHIGGLIGVLESIPVATVWDSGFPYSTATYLDYLQAIEDNGSDFITPRRGDLLDWDENLTVECIHPVEPLGSDANNASIVLRVTFENVSFLFTGDLETTGGENVILSALSQGFIDDISADVLKVGHHGSYTSTSISWLEAVDPDYAAIEVGYGNPYGHPHNEVVQRLENYGALIYRTDQDGTFIISTDGNTLEVHP